MIRFRRLLVPHDFSSEATRALRIAAALATAPGSRIRVLHAITPYENVPEIATGQLGAWMPPAELIAHQLKRLEALVGRALSSPDGPHVECRVVIGNPAQCILDGARGMDAIVLGTTGRTGLANLLIGSVAEKVLRHATIPVLTIPRTTR
ncbi:MAG TPA: universal stress protein [Candidatus Binatia bacterium]|nr:universal stress protein [Candidatus Binatia bacterium]